MRNRYVAIVFSLGLLAHASAWAQCTPDTNVSGIFEPSFAEGLPNAKINEAYSATIHLNVPEDTSYLSLTAVVDSMVLTDVEGLPTGLSYECNPSSCVFPGGTFGCIELVGTPTDPTEVGDHPLVAKFDFHVHTSTIPSVTLPYDIDGYVLTVEEGDPLNTRTVAAVETALFVEPNPVRENSKLVFDLPKDGSFTLSMYSLLGSEVASIQEAGNQGRMSYPVAEFGLQPGVYFVALKQGSYSKSLRFVVQ